MVRITMLRTLLIIFFGLGWPRVVTAMPILLEAAVQKISTDYDHWAYTQTTVEKNEKGKVLKEAVVRFDPSKPYAEQFTPLKVDGQPPSAADLRKYRKQGERRAERVAQAENEGTSPPRKTLGELMDLERATLVEENADSATFEVPLKKEGNNRLPPEKFQVMARVNKRNSAFESIVAQLRAPMRAEVIVKIKSGVGRLDFVTVDPKFPPALGTISGRGAGSILFVPVGRSYDLKREEFQRVKPFGDRFQVKMGPIKSIDF